MDANTFVKIPEAHRDAVLTIVNRLLHDWIKYMEMRLLSIDWDSPPPDLPRLLRRAIDQTRRSSTSTQGVADLWKAGRRELASLNLPALELLITTLDDDVKALLELPSMDLQGDSTRSQTLADVIRHPGRVLRALRDELETHEEL